MAVLLEKFPKLTLKHISSVNFYEYFPMYLYPLRQGMSEEAKSVVQVGQIIKSGDILAKGAQNLSLNVHSAVGGKVARIHKMRFSQNKKVEPVVEVQLGGSFKTYNDVYEINTSETTLSNIIDTIRTSGVADSSMANISDVLFSKLSNGVNQIVVNAIALEPYSILEEKILCMHMDKIVQSIELLITLSTLNSVSSMPEIVCNSEYFSSRQNFSRLLRKNFREKIKIRNMALYPKQEPSNVEINSHSQFLEMFCTQLKINVAQSLDKMLIISPSLLLILFETLFQRKPYIEKYIQVTTSAKSAYILKAFLGTPISHIIMKLNKVTPNTKYFFYGDLEKKNTIDKFSMPITKDISHFFMLDEERHNSFYKRMKNRGAGV